MLLTHDLAQSELKVNDSDECEYFYSRQKSRAGPVNLSGVDRPKGQSVQAGRGLRWSFGTALRNRKGAGFWRGFHSQT